MLNSSNKNWASCVYFLASVYEYMFIITYLGFILIYSNLFILNCIIYSVDKEPEMTCLINGCNFILKNIPDEVFIYERHSDPEYRFPTVDFIFPYLLVNIGSGVSIMKVIIPV